MALVDKLLSDIDTLLGSAKQKLTTDQFRDTEELLRSINEKLKSHTENNKRLIRTLSFTYYDYQASVSEDFFVNKEVGTFYVNKIILTNLCKSACNVLLFSSSGEETDPNNINIGIGPYQTVTFDGYLKIPRYSTMGIVVELPYVMNSGDEGIIKVVLSGELDNLRKYD